MTGSRAIAFAAVLAASFVDPAAASQAVVVSDSADFGYKQGALIEDGATIRVPGGKSLLLIDASGKGRTINGPYDGKLDSGGAGSSPDPSVIRALQHIFGERADLAAGAVRAAGERPQPPDPQLIDIADSATVCAVPGATPQLWRPKPTNRTTLTLTRMGTGEHAEIDWPSGQTTMPWPASLPIVDGESYQAMIPGALTRPRLVVKVVAIGAPTVAEAGKLADAGCRGQALTMLESIATTPLPRVVP
jgi:hypothetical protein